MPRVPPLEFRRRLRRESTDAERALWSRLRRHRVGPKFRRQHTVGPYTLDFYCPAARLAVELDGGQHYDGIQRVRDHARDRWLAEHGIRVLRYSDADVLLETDAVEDAIWLTVSAPSPQRLAPGSRRGRGGNDPLTPSPPLPNPPARAGGEGGMIR